MESIQEKKRCGIYLRVSTQDQDCSMQRKELTEYAALRGWSIYKIYEDKASGTNPNRKMLAALQSDCHQRHIDVVLVWKLDRLFRSLKGIITTLSEYQELGIDFCSLKDPGMDLSTPSGKLMANLISILSEYEISLIKMRVISGLQAAKARGIRLGRPVSITSAVITEVVNLKAQGHSIRKIEKMMDRRISKSSIERVLKEHKANLEAA